MLVYVRIPLFGTDITEAQIQSWLKKEGDLVREGEEIVELETYKSTFSAEANATGKILKIFHSVGESVSTHVPLAVIATEVDDVFDEILFQQETDKETNASLAHYGLQKLAHTTEETESSVRNTVKLTPRARRELGAKTHFSAQWAAAHFLEGTISDAEIDELISRKPVICIGAGPGIVRAFEIIRRQKQYKVVEILDDNPEFWGKEILGIPVKRGLEELTRLSKELSVDAIYVAVFSEARIKLFEKLKKKAPHLTLLPLIDPRANISTGVVVEEGAVIEAGATIGTNAHIGKGVRIDIGAVIAHDCFLEPFVHIAPGAMMGGKVYIRANTLIGVGATVNANIIIGSNCIVSNSSAVLSDLDDNLLVAGNPATVLSRSRREYNNE